MAKNTLDNQEKIRNEEEYFVKWEGVNTQKEREQESENERDLPGTKTLTLPRGG